MKKLYGLKYFKKSDGICGDDFQNQDKLVKINLNFLLSISDLEEFRLPFSREFVSNYAFIIMSNNDRYYIRESEYKKITKTL